MIRVYIAGPYSGETLTLAGNIRRGRDMAIRLMLVGYAPYCPWNDWELAVRGDIPMECFKQTSMAWLEKADAVIFIGEWLRSRGCLEELERARELGIPCFIHVEDLERHFEEAGKAAPEGLEDHAERIAEAIWSGRWEDGDIR